MVCSRTFSRFAACALAVSALAVSVAPVHAYRMMSSTNTGWTLSYNPVLCDNNAGFMHWNARTINWYHNTNGQGSGKATPLQAAMQTWNNVSTSDFLHQYAGTTAAGFGSDGVNSLSWGTDSVCDTHACHAITGLVLQSGQVIIESDVLFNSNSTLNLNWVTSGPYDPCAEPDRTNNRVDVQGVATHELGHSMGLGHPLTSESSFATATMGAVSCNSDARTLESDDIAALECVENRYPYSPSYEGYFETATCQTISGWAWNANRPNAPSYIEVVDGSTVVDVMPADLYRGDLQAAGKGNGVHAFSFDPDFGDGQWHTIGIRHTGSGNNITWSPKNLVCEARMFGGMFPGEVLDTGGQVYTVGTRFSSSVAGKIKMLYFFKPKGETGSNTLRLWTDGGTQLASVTIPSTSCVTSPGSVWPGQWCGASITPVNISANTYYRVTVNTNTKQSKTGCGIGSGITSGSLTAQSGYWIAGDQFPTNGSCSNFFADVIFDM